jgi:hypothetical protein
MPEMAEQRPIRFAHIAPPPFALHIIGLGQGDEYEVA